MQPAPQSAPGLFATSGDRRSRRIVPIDATRGSVMLFSCLSHFAWWIHPSYPAWSEALAAVGMVATPTFLIISGAMVGMLGSARAPSDNRLKWQLVNRGLFLLTVAHLLIGLTEAHQSGSLVRTLAAAGVVDDIGLATLIAAFFLPRLSDPATCRRIAVYAGLILLAAWIIVVATSPTELPYSALKQILLGGGPGEHSTQIYTSASFQYLAIYALGLPLGQLFGRYSRGEIEPSFLWRRLVYIGTALISAALLLHFAAAQVHGEGSFVRALHATFQITSKTPPSPAYLSFFAGTGMLFAAAQFWMWHRARARLGFVVEWIAVIGRASLFIFVLQYFLYWTLPDLLGIAPNRYCALVFVANVLIMRYAAGVWDRIGGNRWMTFNIGQRTSLAP